MAAESASHDYKGWVIQVDCAWDQNKAQFAATAWISEPGTPATAMTDEAFRDASAASAPQAALKHAQCHIDRLADRIRGRARSECGEAYEYEATWSVLPDEIVWRATVVADGELKGRPTGRISTSGPLADIQSIIRTLVEGDIHDLV